MYKVIDMKRLAAVDFLPAQQIMSKALKNGIIEIIADETFWRDLAKSIISLKQDDSQSDETFIVDYLVDCNVHELEKELYKHIDINAMKNEVDDKWDDMKDMPFMDKWFDGDEENLKESCKQFIDNHASDIVTLRFGGRSGVYDFLPNFFFKNLERNI